MALVTTEKLDTFSLPGSSTKQAIGAILASAASITLVYPVHHVSGTTEITTIVPPGTDFSGFAYLIADGAFTFNTGGNIAKAITAVANQVIPIFYSPVDSLWYPVSKVT